jgi:hypothetical protein
MDSINYQNIKNKIKDSSKGQKIAAAVYLVSAHLSDNDPLKNALRKEAISLSISNQDSHRTSAARSIESLLNTAVIAGIVSEKNASIISLELRHFAINVVNEPDIISHLFVPVLEEKAPRPMVITNPLKIPLINENKSKRQDAILSFINERKSVGIKDISALFSDTSEKTIQRELGALVQAGKITKRGEKRWSVYLAVM